MPNDSPTDPGPSDIADIKAQLASLQATVASLTTALQPSPSAPIPSPASPAQPHPSTALSSQLHLVPLLTRAQLATERSFTAFIPLAITLSLRLNIYSTITYRIDVSKPLPDLPSPRLTQTRVSSPLVSNSTASRATTPVTRRNSSIFGIPVLALNWPKLRFINTSDIWRSCLRYPSPPKLLSSIAFRSSITFSPQRIITACTGATSSILLSAKAKARPFCSSTTWSTSKRPACHQQKSAKPKKD